MKIIAHIETDFPTKFGLPRQSGLVEEIEGKIIFDPEYRQAEAFRGLEAFSHIWLIWKFSESRKENWSATVRPPRLGGNKRIGVFATRSPFRPNDIGLSCVKLVKIDFDSENAPVLCVSGVDMMNNTPIYDIKPYIPFTDCRPDAAEGYTAETKTYILSVNFPQELLEKIPPQKRTAALKALAHDPRPGYKRESQKEYGMSFAGFNIVFTVEGSELTVKQVSAEQPASYIK